MIGGPAIARQNRQLASSPLDLIFRRVPTGRVDLTFVLLDWSCRESYHFLDYLNDQTAPRATYEIIWIEYYARRAAELIRRLEHARTASRHPDVDTYVALGMPPDVYYHKHLMYNLGISLAAGRIVCFCDSDALAQPNLVESIVEQFDADPNLVLHLDEVRNHDRRYYPFNYPPLDEVVGYGCLNWVNGRPAGLLDTADPLHTRNYGACMCALRSDLLAIGGADMHRDYLGHICGPYEMTFRLVNAGRRELWHPSQWLYHVWHPGQAGDQNYAGPHDGAQMSSRALEARRSGRILPTEENPAIARVRTDPDDWVPTTLGDLLDTDTLASWQPQSLERRSRSYRLGDGRIRVLETVASPA
ncbi:MAG TPA: glycosyltransferase family A protein, partial [Pirellulales bacterium]